jgi:hypothetical protein
MEPSHPRAILAGSNLRSTFPIIRSGASDAVVGQRPSVGDVDWPRGAVAAALAAATVGCSSIARDGNGRKRRKRRHSHGSYGFGADLRT